MVPRYKDKGGNGGRTGECGGGEPRRLDNSRMCRKLYESGVKRGRVVDVCEAVDYSAAESVAGILLTACGGDITGGDALALLAARHPIFRDQPAAEFDRAVE